MKERSSAPCRTGDQKLLSASMARQRHAVEVRKPRAARLKDGAGSKVSSAVICILPGGFAGLLTGRMATACASGCALAHLSGAGLAEQKREPERTDEARRQPVSGVGQVVRGGAAMGEHGRRGRHENPDRHHQERQCRVSRLTGAYLVSETGVDVCRPVAVAQSIRLPALGLCDGRKTSCSLVLRR